MSRQSLPPPTAQVPVRVLDLLVGVGLGLSIAALGRPLWPFPPVTSPRHPRPITARRARVIDTMAGVGLGVVATVLVYRAAKLTTSGTVDVHHGFAAFSKDN